MEPEAQPDAIVTERHSGIVKRALAFSLLFVLAILAAYTGYWYVTQSEPNAQTLATERAEQFERGLTSFADKLDVDNQQALTEAQALVASAVSPYEEGRAKLALGLVQLRLDTEAAIATYKGVSIDERYHPFTRSRAALYTVSTYLLTQNNRFANEHVFTGPVWEDFMSGNDNSLRNASINALTYSNDLYANPQALSQLAVFAAEDILMSDLSETERDDIARSVLAQINQATELLARINNEDAPMYVGTQYVVEAATLDNQALALDLLHQAGAGVTETQVATAYRDALEAATAHELTTTHAYHARYHYADWLLRQDAAANQTTIVEVLAPMQTLNANSSFAQSFQFVLANDQTEVDNGQPGQAKNIVRLAKISPSFNTLLRATGISEETLATSN